jgi:hypothetical protein
MIIVHKLEKSVPRLLTGSYTPKLRWSNDHADNSLYRVNRDRDDASWNATSLRASSRRAYKPSNNRPGAGARIYRFDDQDDSHNP